MNRAERRQAQREAIKSATSVARDVAEGRLEPADLERQAVEECRKLFAAPAYPGDPFWDLQGEKCRQHLAAGGVPADELAEWLGVARHREQEADSRGLVAAQSDAQEHDGQIEDPALPTELLATDDPPEPQVPSSPYGPARRIVARGRGLPVDNGLRPSS